MYLDFFARHGRLNYIMQREKHDRSVRRALPVYDNAKYALPLKDLQGVHCEGVVLPLLFMNRLVLYSYYELPHEKNSG